MSQNVITALTMRIHPILVTLIFHMTFGGEGVLRFLKKLKNAKSKFLSIYIIHSKDNFVGVG